MDKTADRLRHEEKLDADDKTADRLRHEEKLDADKAKSIRAKVHRGRRQMLDTRCWMLVAGEW